MPPLEFGSAFSTMLLFFFPPFVGNQRLDKVLVQHVAIGQIARVDAVLEEVRIARYRIEQASHFMDFADGFLLMAHFPGELAALPELVIVGRNDTLHVARFTNPFSALTLVNTDLECFADKASRRHTREDAQIATVVRRPARVVLTKAGVVVTQAHNLSQATTRILS
ncbi:MAG: hypothetical protein ACYDBJ_24765 [Aggregatilineales bacterium]